MVSGGSFWDWSEELDLLRGALEPTSQRAQQDLSGSEPSESCAVKEEPLEIEIRVPLYEALDVKDLHQQVIGVSLEECTCTSSVGSELSPKALKLRHQSEVEDPVNTLVSTADLVGITQANGANTQERSQQSIVGPAESCLLEEEWDGDSSESCGGGTLAGKSAPSDAPEHEDCEQSVCWISDSGQSSREGSPCPSQCSATDCRSPDQRVDKGKDDDKLWRPDSLCLEGGGDMKQVAQYGPAESPSGGAVNPVANPADNPAANPVIDLGDDSDTGGDSVSGSSTCNTSQTVYSDAFRTDEGTRGGGFSLPLPLKLLGMVAHPLSVLRHVPQVLSVLKPGPRTRRERKLPREPMRKPLREPVRKGPRESVVSSQAQRQKLVDRRKQRGAKVSHFTRAHTFLDLTCTDWQSGTDSPPSPPFGPTEFNPPTAESRSIPLPPHSGRAHFTPPIAVSPSNTDTCMPIQPACTPLAHTGRDQFQTGQERPVSMPMSDTAYGTLAASADASEATPPSRNSTTSKPPRLEITEHAQLEIREQAPLETTGTACLESMDNAKLEITEQAWLQITETCLETAGKGQLESTESQSLMTESGQLEINEVFSGTQSPQLEPDSFSLEHSPSSLSLGGGFRYEVSEGETSNLSLGGGFGYRVSGTELEQSPLSSRSTSSSDLDGGEAQSGLDSSTDDFDSNLYLPSNHLTFTPPETPAKAAPPLRPLSEESRSFTMPPGVTDPVEIERLEQEWAHSLRVRRAENGDQCYMSLEELTSPPWNELVFWHGCDKKGQPVLYCRLGLAVRTLPRHMQERMGCALYSMVEVAENHLWRPDCGWGFQRMTTVVDAEGLGITRMAPVESLKHGFKLIHRDYPARQGFVYLVNVPPLLGVMIGVFKRVIGCDDRAANERLGIFGRNYRSQLQKDFELDMLHVDYGGSCTCAVCEGTGRNVASKFGASLCCGPAMNEIRMRRPEDWLSRIIFAS